MKTAHQIRKEQGVRAYTYEELIEEIYHCIEIKKKLGDRQVWFNATLYRDIDINFAINTLRRFGFDVYKDPYDTRTVELSNANSIKVLHDYILIEW